MNIRQYITLSAGLLAISTGFGAAAPATVKNEVILRAGPAASFSAIGHIPAGTKLETTDCRGGWCQVDFNGITGFVGAADFGTAGGVRSPPRASAENAQRSQNRVSRRSAPASSSTSSAPLNHGADTTVHAQPPSAPQSTHP